MSLQEMRDAHPNTKVDWNVWEEYLQDPRMWIQDMGVVDGKHKFIAHVREVENEAHAPHAVDDEDVLVDESDFEDCGFCQYNLDVAVRMQKRHVAR